jgi:uncharacterized membrane protein
MLVFVVAGPAILVAGTAVGATVGAVVGAATGAVIGAVVGAAVGAGAQPALEVTSSTTTNRNKDQCFIFSSPDGFSCPSQYEHGHAHDSDEC